MRKPLAVCCIGIYCLVLLALILPFDGLHWLVKSVKSRLKKWCGAYNRASDRLFIRLFL